MISLGVTFLIPRNQLTAKNILPDEVRIANKPVRYLEMLYRNQYSERQESLHTIVGGKQLCIGKRFWLPLPLLRYKKKQN